jgi:PAS domain S-box-containing protein
VPSGEYEMEQEQEDILTSKRKLLELEDYIRQMWRFLPIPIAFISPLGIILEFNGDMGKLVGYVRENLAGKSLFDYCPEKEKLAQIQECTLSGRPVRNYEECSLINAQGQKILVSLSTLVRMDEESREPIGYFAAFIDITERKQIEEKHQAIVRTALDGFWLCDINGRFLEVNDSYCQMIGYTQEALLRMSIQDVEAVESSQDTARRIEKIASQGYDRFESRHKCKDGEIIDVEVSVNYLDVGEGQFFVFVRDITERKEAAALYQALATSSPIGVYTVQDGKFQFVNPQFMKISGFNEAELLGTDALRLVHPEDRAMVRENAVAMLKGERFSPYEFRVISKGGETIWAMETVVSTYYKGKRATLGNFMDITESKQAEEKIQELYHKETELRRELEAEINKRIEYARVLVHELKTPLTPILAASELLAGEVREERLLRLVGSIQKSASTMNTRIATLLDLAKGELGVLELNCNQIDPLQLLRRVGDEMSSVASTRKLSLILDVPSSLPSVWADEGRLEQVISNLLTNAFKWSPEGGKVTLRAREKGATLTVEVQDAGPGIAEENQQKIFDTYYRVESDRQRLNGLGLGLALCKTIIESHGGKIWVESREGKGSTFGFSVPLSAAD